MAITKLPHQNDHLSQANLILLIKINNTIQEQNRTNLCIYTIHGDSAMQSKELSLNLIYETLVGGGDTNNLRYY